nr:outer membrane lipoprotein carrier protein LolA [uncultured Prevotella sp.]
MKLYIRNFIVGAVLSLGTVLPMSAQQLRKVTAQQSAVMIKEICKSAQTVKALSCDFIQVSEVSFLEEKVTSRGLMKYRNMGSLVWQYTSPFKYTFSIDNNVVTMKSGSRTQSVDLAASKTFQNVVKMVKSSITGQNLNNNRDFSVVMYAGGSTWMAQLTPRHNQMKQFVKTVSLYFDKSRRMVNKVVMMQANGDKITIELTNIKVSR